MSSLCLESKKRRSEIVYMNDMSQLLASDFTIGTSHYFPTLISKPSFIVDEQEGEESLKVPK